MRDHDRDSPDMVLRSNDIYESVWGDRFNSVKSLRERTLGDPPEADGSIRHSERRPHAVFAHSGHDPLAAPESGTDVEKVVWDT